MCAKYPFGIIISRFAGDLNCLFVIVIKKYHLHLYKNLKNCYNKGMNNQSKAPSGWRGLLAAAVQAAIMGGVSLTACLSEGGPTWLGAAMLYVVLPLAGGFTACRAVGRGLSNYLAWIVPPVALYAVHLLLWGYVPPVAPALLTAFISVIGAAAGEVMRQQGKPPRGHDARH